MLIPDNRITSFGFAGIKTPLERSGVVPIMYAFESAVAKPFDELILYP